MRIQPIQAEFPSLPFKEVSKKVTEMVVYHNIALALSIILSLSLSSYRSVCLSPFLYFSIYPSSTWCQSAHVCLCTDQFTWSDLQWRALPDPEKRKYSQMAETLAAKIKFDEVRVFCLLKHLL